MFQDSKDLEIYRTLKHYCTEWTYSAVHKRLQLLGDGKM